MAGNLVVDALNFTSTPDFTNAGKWMRGFVIGPREYEKAFPDSPGVDGTARKRFGFRQRKLHCNVTYVAADYNTTISNAVTDMDTIPNKSFSVTIGGTAFPACELESSSAITEP